MEIRAPIQSFRNRSLFLVDLDAELVDNRLPERNVPFETLSEFLRRRIAVDLESRFDQPLLIGLVGERRASRLRDLLDDGFLGPSRRCDPNQPYVRDSWKSLLSHGWNVRRTGKSRRIGQREHPNLTGPMHFECLTCNANDGEHNLPCDEIDEGRPGAAVRHLYEIWQVCLIS